MRFLHTADWHVGRTVRGRSRAAEHQAVLAELAALAQAHEVDGVLVVGDLFDTAAPTAESERIVYRALLDLAATGARVVVLAGNHDSDRRLQAVEPLLELGQVITRPVFSRPDDGGLVEVPSRDGRELALVATLPFLSQRYVIKADDLLGLDAADAALQYGDRMRRLVRALTDCFATRSDTVNVVAAHCMVHGGLMGGGERLAHTIFEYSVDATAFPSSAHYVALGHLHRQQRVPGPCPIYYSGSPLQLDFGEGDNQPAALLVEAVVGRPAKVTPLALTSGRRLRTIRGTLDQLAALDPSGAGSGADFLRVIVREPWRLGLADDVRQLLGDDVVDVVIERPDGAEATARASGVDVMGSRVGRSPRDLFSAYLQEQEMADERLLALFDELLEEAS